MALALDQILKTSGPQRHITLIYGQPGIGKTTLAAQAPNAVFLPTENGHTSPELDGKVRYLTAKGTTIRSLSEMRGWLDLLASNGIEYPEGVAPFETVVIDSLSELEKLIHDKVIEEHNRRVPTSQAIKTIAEIDFQRGYDAALQIWYDVIAGIKAIRDDAKMSVIILEHSTQRNIERPDAPRYQRFEPLTHKTAWPTVTKLCDNVLFASQDVITRTETHFGQDKAKGVRLDERKLYTTDKATHVAKNRCSMPPEIDMTWASFAQYVPFMAQENQPAKSE